MAYKYYTAPMPTIPTSASAAWLNDFQAMLTYQFDNSNDVYTIGEETVFASGSYVDIQVRVTGAVSAESGTKLGDDWKRILFKDISHPVSPGMMYYFDDNGDLQVGQNCDQVDIDWWHAADVKGATVTPVRTCGNADILP